MCDDYDSSIMTIQNSRLIVEISECDIFSAGNEIQYLLKTTGHFAQRVTIVFACKYSIAQLYSNYYAQAGTFNVII